MKKVNFVSFIIEQYDSDAYFQDKEGDDYERKVLQYHLHIFV